MSAASEQRAAERDAALVAAVHQGCEGLDDTAARHILAAVVPVLRRQLFADLRVMCETNGLPCAGDGCHHEFAAAIALGGAR